MLWKNGPASQTGDAVVVNVGELTLSGFRDLPSVMVASMRLRHSWSDLEGAVALAFDSKPLRLKFRAISVWESEGDLERFLKSPAHVAVQRAHRPRVRGDSLGTWTTPRFVRSEIEKQSRRVGI